ncbi:hypothetical protein J1779_11190 [Rahnella sp. FC061912-K]|uniref:hypothetical protein n=1 Tax=Rahnella rivi TaxID=2816249 RepID=UPI001C27AFC2|nr:hypothetical protein [Rahnella rivi]MBU9830503.1 hypothetical protein [Rahnella rivi]
MTRHELMFDITYSYHLEKMYSVLTGRIDRAITFIIIAAGCSVFISLYNHALFGVIIAVLSVCQVVYQFGRYSGISEDQAKKYLMLRIEADDCDESELNKRYKSLLNLDSTPWGILCSAAYKRTSLALGLDDKTPKLTFLEKCFAWLAGDLPRE